MDADQISNVVSAALPNSIQNRVEVLESVDYLEPDDPNYQLHFQKVIYHLNNDRESWKEFGFRFMWSHQGRLCGHRGQARIPDSTVLFKLITQAMLDGWFTLPKGVSINIQ